ncbi:hypothetical protein GCM10010302_33600 [Streptomyces polychromogenes]|uniref:Integral membrane protein n=1 Tax=Streptomyces polychromogenes TaxID=67342 RepID=A0ABP3F3R7_9ACTN
MLAETICSAVSAAGLGIAAVTAYRRRFLRAARIAAYALVPVGLVLTGVVAWLSGIVFKPTVWIGLGLLGLAWVLLTATRAVERRGAGGAAKAPAAVAPGASAPALGGGATGPAPKPQAAPAEDFSDIEAILKKHGI